MKQIDLSQPVLDRNGNNITAKIKVPAIKELDNGEIVEEQTFKAVILTLGHALRDSVLTVQFAVELEEKMKRYRLFQKMEKDAVIEFSDEEINDLKKYINERYEVAFVGQVVDILDAE